MAGTAKEARGKVCLMVLVNPNENLPVSCCPEECSAWSWSGGCEASEERTGRCVLGCEEAVPLPENLKAG